MGKHITDYFLYRWRFILGYGVIGLTVIGLLLIVGLYVPGGISEAEMRTAVISNALSLDSFNPESIINLPYHLLQRFSFSLSGVSLISIKLPSLILGVLSVAGLLVLLQTWFRRNVAIITTVLVVATGQFLFIAQSGTPSILYVFWSVWLLAAAMMISRRANWGIVWKIVLFAVAALSLYTPLSIYILLALVSAVALHPHLRFLVRRLSKARLAIATLCALVLIAPLVYAIVQQPSIAMRLLGIPNQWPDLMANLGQLFHQYFGFASPNTNELMTPIYGLGAMLLIALGVYRLFTTKYTARSYIITAWIVLLLPILIINPDYVSITFVPVVLLMGMGIGILLGHWYRLFPQNPYARIAGLIPLSVLIAGMVFSGLDRYMYGYHYDPQVTSSFSRDLQLVNRQLNEEGRPAATIITSEDKVAFYTVVADYNENVTVTTSAPQQAAPLTLVTHDADVSLPAESLYRIVTDDSWSDADRLYVYKTE